MGSHGAEDIHSTIHVLLEKPELTGFLIILAGYDHTIR